MNLTLEREGTLPFFKIYPKQDLLLFLIKKELHETRTAGAKKTKVKVALNTQGG